MEKNTFATSAYIATSPESAFEYLCSLKNLDDWTLFSRMQEQVDEDTWLGTASGYHKNLYYHVKKLENPLFYGIEWHCGFEYQKYFQVYPVLLFPPDYIEPGTDEEGVYFHWLSFVDPKRQTQMIMQGIHTVHTSECRSLKGILERQTGRTTAAKGRYFIDTDTIYIDAPIEIGVEYLSDLRNLDEWAHLVRPSGEITRQSGEFRDEYDQKVNISVKLHGLSKYYLLEEEYFYPDYEYYQRSVALLIPTSYAFGDPDASGLILHRITFWKADAPLGHGKLQIEDFGAESMNIKRMLEAKAGNLQSFDKGMSYVPKTPELVATH
ncbi:scytonemin biosynthesis cyclase/decarboxylase ScyC [Nostoc sp. CCY0012]|uniref:scytonemin biosynthesis cyclase/decarboxylase ScyC n=1 Tax=Nostoc sp. CCY0012 TaxID=1056123 RepID=UPI0039C5D6DA